MRAPHHRAEGLEFEEDDDGPVRVEVVERAPCVEWRPGGRRSVRGWVVEFWSCGHGAVTQQGNIKARRDCRLCAVRRNHAQPRP